MGGMGEVRNVKTSAAGETWAVCLVDLVWASCSSSEASQLLWDHRQPIKARAVRNLERDAEDVVALGSHDGCFYHFSKRSFLAPLWPKCVRLHIAAQWEHIFPPCVPWCGEYARWGHENYLRQGKRWQNAAPGCHIDIIGHVMFGHGDQRKPLSFVTTNWCSILTPKNADLVFVLY